MAKSNKTPADLLDEVLGSKTKSKSEKTKSTKQKVEAMTKETESRYPIHSPRRVNGAKKDGTTVSVVICKEDFDELKKFLRYEEDNDFGSGQKSVLLAQVIHEWVEKNLRPYSE